MKLLTIAGMLAMSSVLLVPTSASSHGCHRFAQDGPEGWHRHVGPACVPVRSGPSEQNPYAPCTTRCRYVGPVKQCRQVCRGPYYPYGRY